MKKHNWLILWKHFTFEDRNYSDWQSVGLLTVAAEFSSVFLSECRKISHKYFHRYPCIISIYNDFSSRSKSLFLFQSASLYVGRYCRFKMRFSHYKCSGFSYRFEGLNQNLNFFAPYRQIPKRYLKNPTITSVYVTSSSSTQYSLCSTWHRMFK